MRHIQNLQTVYEYPAIAFFKNLQGHTVLTAQKTNDPVFLGRMGTNKALTYPFDGWTIKLDNDLTLVHGHIIHPDDSKELVYGVYP